MTHLGILLDSEFALRTQGNPSYTLDSYSRDLGLSPSTLRRILAGKSEGLNRSTRRVLVQRFSQSELRRAELLAAYLRDQLRDDDGELPGANLVRVTAGEERAPRSRETSDWGDLLSDHYSVDLKTARALDRIGRLCASNDVLRRHVRDTALLAGD